MVSKKFIIKTLSLPCYRFRFSQYRAFSQVSLSDVYTFYLAPLLRGFFYAHIQLTFFYKLYKIYKNCKNCKTSKSFILLHFCKLYKIYKNCKKCQLSVRNGQVKSSNLFIGNFETSQLSGFQETGLCSSFDFLILCSHFSHIF